MPRGDKTGPAGQGPRTGRGLGYCSGSDTPGFIQPGFGRGMGYGRGMGLGRGMGFRRGRCGFYGRGFWPQAVPMQVPNYPAPVPRITKEQEKQILSQDLEYLENQIQAIKKRIEELDKPE